MLALLLFLVPASPAAADVDALAGGATGVTVTGFLGSIGPTPTVTLAADESSPASALGPLTGASPGVSLPGFPGLFSTGALSVETSAVGVAGENHGAFVEARTSAATVNAGAALATATSIVSACRASGEGSVGNTVIMGGMFNGQPFPVGTLLPNTVIDVAGLGTVTLNEQVHTDVAGSAGITVNAVHARYASGPGGILPGGQSAEAVIGHVTCAAVGPDVNVPTTLAPPTSVAPVTVTVPVSRATSPVRRSLAATGSDSPLAPALALMGGALLLRLVIAAGRPPASVARTKWPDR